MSAVPGLGETFGRYTVEQRLGMGGMGIVFLALDTHMQRRVALKVMSGQLAGDAQFLERFHREAETLTRLDSPHIITIFDHGEVEETPYIATQYVAGGDLGDVLQSRGPMPPAMAADVASQVAEALEDAHRAGVIHRDVKSSNVLVRDPGAARLFVYLCDFGIASSGDSQLTQPGGVAGSWAYLSPERTRDEPATPASDIYALGCLFYACLTGHTPYSGSDVEIAVAHAQQPVPQLSGSGPDVAEVNRVLATALAKQPEDRYRSAADFGADLRRLAGDSSSGPLVAGTDRIANQTVTRPPASARAGSRSSGRKKRTGVLIGAALAAVLVIGGAVIGVKALGGDDDSTSDKADKEGTALPKIDDPIAGDWDNDGLGDVRIDRSVFQDSLEPLPQQLLTSTGDAFADPVEDLGQQERAISGDVDGDGRLDVVVAEEVNDDTALRVDLWVSGEDGPTGKPATQQYPWNNEKSFGGIYGLGDFTGDGRDDLLMTRNRADEFMSIAVAESNGSGFDEPVEFLGRTGRENAEDEMSPADVDGDGLDDIVVRITNGEDVGLRVRVLLNTGDAFKPQPVTQLKDGRYGFSDFVAADVDGDGADELVQQIPEKFEDLPNGDYTVGTALTVMEFVNNVFVTPKVWAEPDFGLDGIPFLEIGASDVDGDGLEDIVRFEGYDEGSGEIDVFRAEDGAFAKPETWATLECGNDCDGATAKFVESFGVG